MDEYEFKYMLEDAVLLESDGRTKKAKEKLNEIFEETKNNFTFILKKGPSLLFYLAKYSSVNEARNLLNYFSRECKKIKLEDIIVTLFSEYCAQYAEKNEKIKTALFFYNKVIDGYNDNGLFMDSIKTAYHAKEITEEYKIDKKKFRKKLEDSIKKYENKDDSEDKILESERRSNKLTIETGIQHLFNIADSMVPNKYYPSLPINYIKQTLSEKSAMED